MPSEPLVSILWLNYNSARILDIVLESLKGIAELDYDNYELIVVDNGSSDGSIERITRFIEANPVLRKRTRVIRLRENLGFTGGMNVAYRARSRDARYVLLLNNDAIPTPEGLKRLVEEMEGRPKLAAAQGIILRLGEENRVDTAGGFLSRYIVGAPLLAGREPRLSKPLYITYADGAYALIRVEAVEKVMGDRLFYDELFAYCDDNILGLMLWNGGWKVATFPVIVARHRRGSTFRVNPRKVYYSYRCFSLIYHAAGLGVREKLVARMYYTLRTLALSVGRSPKLFAMMTRAWRDGARLAEKLRPPIRLSAAPLAPFTAVDVVKAAILPRSMSVEPGVVERLYPLES